MPNASALQDQDLGPGDVACVVSALLEGIRRGELEASEREVEFLTSVAELLDDRVGSAA